MKITIDQVINDVVNGKLDRLGKAYLSSDCTGIRDIIFYISDDANYNSEPAVVKKSFRSKVKTFLGFDDSHLQ